MIYYARVTQLEPFTPISVHTDPPSAVVSGENVTSLEESLSINCLANSGNPSNYTFSHWQHKWHSQTNSLREIESTTIENNKAILQLENITFKDSGYYKCFVSNGIGTSSDNNYVATDEMFLFIKGKSVYLCHYMCVSE